jgi:hypothetical protein
MYYLAALMEDFSQRMSSLLRNLSAVSAAPERSAPSSGEGEPMEEEEPEGPLLPSGTLRGHGCDGDEGRPCTHPSARPFGTVSSAPCSLSSSELRPLHPFQRSGQT